MPKQTLRWSGSTICDFCWQNARDKGDHFYDAQTVHAGKWALMCEPCQKTHGFPGSLGTGKGQKYRSDTLEKVAG